MGICHICVSMIKLCFGEYREHVGFVEPLALFQGFAFPVSSVSFFCITNPWSFSLVRYLLLHKDHLGPWIILNLNMFGHRLCMFIRRLVAKCSGDRRFLPFARDFSRSHSSRGPMAPPCKVNIRKSSSPC